MEPIMDRLSVRLPPPPPAENADQNSEMLFLSANFCEFILIGAMAASRSFKVGV